MIQKLGPIQQRWVDALRSGEYKQGRHQLRDQYDQYCCLGVLCDVVDPEGWTRYNTHQHRNISPSASIYNAVSMRMWGTADKADLSYLNDTLNLTFSEIADKIEANPEEFFCEQV